MTSFMIVPLAARGRLFGSMFFASADERRTYGHEHLVLAEALGARAALALDNAVLYREAQQARQARDDFLLVASHELRTPLTALRLAVAGLRQRSRTASTGGCPALLLDAVERTTARLTALVDELLDISRLTSGNYAPALSNVDFDAVVADVLGASAEMLRRAACAVELRHRGPMNGSWDPAWISRIVVNLVSNAAKYGVGKPIEIDLEGDDRKVVLTVRDYGIGIAPEEQARIFQRFERAASARHYGGFGLGLWIVRQMTEALGGTVRVESQPGAGATFTIELPRQGPRLGLTAAA
jgi:signal transduction histidine kinase